MGGIAVYVISARPELEAQLRGRADPRCIEILTRPIAFGTDGLAPLAEDELARRKLLILARFRELTAMSDDQAVRFLGDANISIEVFDKWWDVRFEVGGRY